MDRLSSRCVSCARKNDLDVIVSLVNGAFQTHALMAGRDRTSLDGLIEELGNHGRFILAECDGRLVGCAMIQPIDEHHAVEGYAPPPGALYFGLAGVDTSMMKSGIGRKLLAEAERFGRANGHSHLALNTLREFDLVPYYTGAGCTQVFEEHFPAGHWGLGAPLSLCHFEKAL